MGTLLQNLLVEARIDPGAEKEPFAPVARYYPTMDFLLYLNEDCSYRADRVDPFLTLLWHPYENKLVGIKLKGFKFLFERLKALCELEDNQFFPIIKAIELAVVGGMGDAFMEDPGKTRVAERQKKYDYARALVKSQNATFQVAPEEFAEAA